MIVTALALAAAVYGLWIAGSPGAERARKLDERRASDLQQLSYAVDQFWNNEKRLPSDLDELTKSRDIYIQSIADPETGATYEYRASGVKAYELCATFQSASVSDRLPKPYARPPEGGDFWNHPAGAHCYQLDVREFGNPKLE